ncbi:transferase [Sphingomonas solaris]|uniref:Transferase n=1 Tax=Alterirhizorhabdus solaris TaxID=2529389 RepID=A0A558RD65_9SPHN|nr:transferase [Sphingomonas solaris]TVV77261.1 transferase [Sphingomonas solaris]
MEDLLITTFAESPKIADAADYIEKAVWARLGFLNFSDPFVHYFDLMERYPDYQIAVVDRQRDFVVATGNLIPLYHDDLSTLPDGGWDWALRQAAATVDRAPNMVVGLSVSVPDAYRNRGLARVVLGAMRNLAESKGLGTPYLPVRPTMREFHLDIDIADYVTWRRDDGKLFDPWLRSHEGAGGRMVGLCRESMVIRKPVNFWEAWSGQRYEASGRFPIAGGLAPVTIDLERGIGTYVEPNVWYH